MVSTGGYAGRTTTAVVAGSVSSLLEGLSEEVVETFGGVPEEGIVLEEIVELGEGVSVGVSVGATVLLPLALPVGRISLTPAAVTAGTARAPATAAVPQHMVVIPLLVFVAQHFVRFRNGTELIGGGGIISVFIGVVFEGQSPVGFFYFGGGSVSF